MTPRAERLGTAPVGRLLAGLAAQSTAAVMLYGFYTLANTFFVARGVDPFAAGGVAVVAPVLLVLGAISSAIGAGGASIVSRALGAGDAERAARTTAHCFALFWGTALVITIAGLAFLGPLLTALGTTPELMVYARPYAAVILAGAVTATGFSSLIRAEGNARYAMFIWLIPVIVNLALDPLLILVLGLGTAGAGIATVACQTVSAGMSVYYFFFSRSRAYRVERRHFRPCPAVYGEILAVGSPSLISQGSLSALTIIVNHVLGGLGGAIAVTAFGVVARLMTFFVMPQTGIVQGVQPIIGYNHAAGWPDRVRRAVWLALAASAGYGLAVAGVAIGLARVLVGIFVDPGPVATLGAHALTIVGLSFPFKGTAVIAAAYFQSQGRIAASFALPLAGIGLVQLPALLGLSHAFGLAGTWWSFAITDAVMTAVSSIVLARALAPTRGRAPASPLTEG